MQMSYEKEQADIQRARLREVMNKVPDKIASGSIQATREWLRLRAQAEKLVKNPRATATQLLGMIGQLQ
jgi:hypothetical protein